MTPNNRSGNRNPPEPTGGKRTARARPARRAATREGSAGKSGLPEGRLVLTVRGFGFVSREDGPDILIPFDHLGTATSGDTVQVELFPESAPDKPAGRVMKVVRRSDLPIVGRVGLRGKEVRLYPEGQRINRAVVLDPDALQAFVAAQNLKGGIRDGDVVSADLSVWDDPKAHPIGIPRAFIGRGADAESEVKLIALARGFSLEFPPAVLKAAEQLDLPSIKQLSEKRTDLRNEICFTIDPKTAKDFDDALSIRQRDDGLLEVGIHIADVSYFVAENGIIDDEARKRATSVYLVNTVLPMLPERLSNKLCSLVPGEPRLAMTVKAALDSTGRVAEVAIFESIIESRRRFTYQEVEEILHGKADPLAPQMHLLHLLTQQLKRGREKDGSVDLDLSAPLITLDENGVPVSIRPSERLDSQRMVEESMLLANRLVAEQLLASGSPGIYRVHDQPRQTDVENLIGTLGQLGIKYTVGEEFKPDDYRNILAIIENLEFKDFVEALAMRSLNKAVYDIENRGHFGLAMDAYTHFTSPIRRYPDLVVHRMLKRHLARGGGRGPAAPSGKSQRRPRANPQLLKFLRETCEHSSNQERAATGAERAYTRLKALQYLQQRLGREYAGTVSGVTSFGLFVEIDRYLVEGLVPIATLGKERFELERSAHRLVGQKTGTAFRLGDRVRIAVKKVDTGERRAEFLLV
jgi:ribonuclease R